MSPAGVPAGGQAPAEGAPTRGLPSPRWEKLVLRLGFRGGGTHSLSHLEAGSPGAV